MKIIVAADKNWGIGKDNKLLVSIPADLLQLAVTLREPKSAWKMLLTV